MKAIKITNPLYIGAIGPHIKKLTELVKVRTITYESLYTYFTQAVQFGGNASEFWIAYNDDDEPVAFAHWFVNGIPHVGCTTLDFIHTWEKSGEATKALYEEWIKFGQRFNAPYYRGDVINTRVWRYAKKICIELGFDMDELGIIHFIARKRQGG